MLCYFSLWKHTQVAFRLADIRKMQMGLFRSQSKPEVYLLHYVTHANDRMISLTCVSYMTPHYKQTWRTGSWYIAISYLYTVHNVCMSSFQADLLPLVTVFTSHCKFKWNARKNLLESRPSGKSEQWENLPRHSIHHSFIQRGNT